MIDEQTDEISSAVAQIMASRYQPKVGDRVRIRLSGECQFKYVSGVVHFPQTDGAIGEITAIPCGCGGDHDDTHSCTVFFDPRPRWNDNGINRSVVSHCFAPTELEYLDG